MKNEFQFLATCQKDAAKMLYDNALAGLAISAFAAFLLVFSFDNPQIDNFKLAWLVTMCVMLLSRFLDVLWWKKNHLNTDFNGPKSIQRFAIGAIATAFMWCTYSLYVFQHQEIIELACTIMIISGMAGGASTVLAASKKTAVFYTLILLLPFSLTLLFAGEQYQQILGFLGLGFTLVMYTIAVKSAEFTSQAIKLKNENMLLVHNMEEQVAQRTMEIHHLSNIDPLTGLSNRTAFLFKLQQQMDFCEYHQQNLAVLFIDLDGFKKINDSLGHEVGDQILKVKQEDENESINVVGMRLADAIKYIKGPKGTVVTLTLKKVDGTIQDISITRDVVELEETYAKSSIVEKEGKTFGVINLPKFYISFEDYNERNAASDIKKEILRLKEEGVEGLVMDLRNNGGGSLQTVVDIAGLFIEEGPIVQVKTTGSAKEVLADKDKSIVWDGPLVILVNELSASASEILAAAMQDYKRGIVIGSKQTYGKGTVQTVMDLNRMVKNNTKGDMGALKFTTQKFYRINGGSTQLEGVKSDVIVPDRYSYIDIGEKNQDNPLAWDKIDAADYEVWGNYFDYDTTISKSKARMAANEQLKLIDANAQWVKKIRDRESYSLNYETYKKEMDINEEEAKRFAKLSEYQTDLTFTSLPYEVKLMDKDSVLLEKRNRWHEALAKDVYVEEAINVLHDLKMTYAIKNKVAESVKN